MMSIIKHLTVCVCLAAILLSCGAALLHAEPAVREYTANGLNWTGKDAAGVLVWGMELNPIDNLAEVDVDNNGVFDFHPADATAVDPADGLASQADGTLFRWDFNGSPARQAGLHAGNNSYTLELDLDVKSTGVEGGNGVFGVLLGFTDADDRGRVSLGIKRTGLTLIGGTATSNVFSELALSQSNIGKHTWRIAYEASDTNFWFYRDGVLLNKDATGVSGSLNLGPTAVTAFIGDYSASLAGDWELDALVLDPGGAFAAPPLRVSSADVAENVTTNSARLVGRLDWTNAAPTTVSVFWGKSDGGSTMSAWDHTNAFGVVEAGATSAVDVPLDTDSLYYYRFYASNAVSQAWAAATPTFFTAVPSITVTNHAAEVGPDTGEFIITRPAAVAAEPWSVDVLLDSVSTAREGSDYDAFERSVVMTAGQEVAIITITPTADGFPLEGTETVVLSLVPSGFPASPSATLMIEDTPMAVTALLQPDDLEGAQLWLDAGDVDADGQPDVLVEETRIGTWADKSGAGHDALQADPAMQPFYWPDALAHRPVIQFRGAQVLAAGDTSTFKFLHDGSGSTVFCVYRKTSDEQLDYLVDTGGNTGANSGFSLAPRDDGGYEDQMYFAIMNAGEPGQPHGGNYVGHPTNTWILTAQSYHFGAAGDDIALYKDGATVVSVDDPDTPSAANASRVLGIGGYSTGQFGLDGELAEVIIYNKALNSNELSMVGTYLSTKYDLSTTYDYPALAIDNVEGAYLVSDTMATLRGQLGHSDGLTNDVHVLWGQTDGGTNLTAWAHTNVLGHRAVGPLSTNVTVQSDATYYYRYYVSTAAGAAWAPHSARFISGTVTLAATDDQAGEAGVDAGLFTVTRSVGASSQSLTLRLSVGVASTATEGADYLGLPRLFVLEPGQTSTNIALTPVDDWTVNEGDETVVLSLVPGAYVDGATTTGVVTIVDRTKREGKSSQLFAYRYECDSAHLQNQDLDNDGNDDWAHFGDVRQVPWPGAPSGSILNPADLAHDSLSTNSIWNTAAFDGDYTIEASVRVISQSNTVDRNYLGAMTVWTAVSGPGTDTGLLYIGTNAVYYGTGGAALLSVQKNTDRLHTYRLVRRSPANSEAMFWVWRDHVLLNPAGAPMASTFSDARDMMLLGDTSFDQNGVWELDYLRMTRGAYAPRNPSGLLLIVR